MNDADNSQWRGTHVSSLQSSFNRYQYPQLIRNDEHTILVKLPVTHGQIPECYPSILNSQDRWDHTHVKLPCSDKNITQNRKRRWDVVREIFANVLSSQQLEAAILSYNHRYAEMWNFSTLHAFFNEVLEERETAFFFETLFPKIVDLALHLPQLITEGIPLLKRGFKHSVSLSQTQISSLLANAFLCTFPHRNWNGKNSEYSDYPEINFNRLFQCEDSSRSKSVHEKLKCIINYFRRVTTSVPTGIVTYSRQLVPNHSFPEWLKSNNKVPHLYVSSTGTIEDDGFGLFQVDFANKYVGGGVIGMGCVQEEIRFVICPELMLSRLFTQILGENDALVVTGCERFNSYRGYGRTFEWTGDYIDETPFDEYGRKYCTVIAVDALCYQGNPNAQYLTQNVARDLNKAYVGFSWGNRRRKEELCGVATGNWGCGVFAGDPQLKSIIQLLAAGEAGRDLAYFTFGDTKLRDSIADIHKFLSENAVTIGRICQLLISYSNKNVYERHYLFEFLKMEALKKENPVSNNEERHSKYFSEKTSKTFFTPKLAKNQKPSMFRKEKASETSSEKDHSDLIFEVTERSEQQSPTTYSELDANEERLKQSELRKFSELYDRAVPPPRQEDDEHPSQNSFKFLDEIKQKMKNSFTKSLPIKPPVSRITDELEKLETDILTQLSVDDDEIVKATLRVEHALNEIVIEKRERWAENDTPEINSVQLSVDKDENAKPSVRHEQCDLNEIVIEKPNQEEKLDEQPMNKSYEKLNDVSEIYAIEEEEISKPRDPTVSSPINLVTLSDLSARLSKSATCKSSKERFSQKRKINDYFSPLNKKKLNSTT